MPALRVRAVNVTDLMILSANGTHPHSLTHEVFNSLFTEDKPIHFDILSSCKAYFMVDLFKDGLPSPGQSHICYI